MNLRLLYSAPVLIAGLALLLRLAYVFELDASPLFQHPAVDADTYNQHAERLAAGNWLSRGIGPFWQPPLFPYSLGAVKLLFPGPEFFYAARLLQALIDALTCVLVFYLGTRLFGRAAGIGAGVVTAAYGPMIFFAGELLPATTAAFLDTLGLLLLLRALDRQSPWRFLAAGISFGLAAVTVPTVLPFCAAAAAWVAVSGWRARDMRHAAEAALLFLLGVALPIAPVSLRNYTVGNDAVLISYNGGINFYAGNNGDTGKTLGARPGWEWDDLVDIPQHAGIDRPSEKSRYFYRQAGEFIASEPLAWAGLLAEKTYAFWHGDEIGRNQAVYFWRNYSHLLSALLWKTEYLAFPFGLIAPLALAGMALYLVRCRAPRLLPAPVPVFTLPRVPPEGLIAVLFVGLYAAAVIAFFPTARYRIPLCPLLALFAVYGVMQLGTLFRYGGKRSPVAIATLAAVVLLAGALNHRLAPMDLDGDALIHYNIGNAEVKKRDIDGAMASFKRSVAIDPEFWQAWINLGSMYAMTGQRHRAVETFEKVRDRQPHRFGVWINLAHAYRAGGRTGEALHAYERALRTADPILQAFTEYISFCFELRDFERARRGLDAAVARFPEAAESLRSFHDRHLARALRG